MNFFCSKIAFVFLLKSLRKQIFSGDRPQDLLKIKI
ncbi:hypothetical protein FIC_01756 [Flavobacteriaceae bacterium 3519-10]|nr:hypothetical protein FIC_01756 [Flavobacteriaceae bacterium 3519-10]